MRIATLNGRVLLLRAKPYALQRERRGCAGSIGVGMKTKKRNMAEAVEPLRSWYALRVFHNRFVEVSSLVEKSGCEYYVPMKTVERTTGTGRSTVRQPIFPSLLFVRSEKSYVENICKQPKGLVGVYCMPGMKEPAAIPDEEMRMFIFVTTIGSRNLEAVDPALAKGDRVRITGGVFRGGCRVYRPHSECQAVDRRHRGGRRRSHELHPEGFHRKDR